MNGAPFSLGALRKFGEHMTTQSFEHASVAEKSRNGDVATFVEHAPLRWVGFEPLAVRRETCELEDPQASLESLADLPAHFAKAQPAEAQSRQSPLQESCTVRIVHPAPG